MKWNRIFIFCMLSLLLSANIMGSENPGNPRGAAGDFQYQALIKGPIQKGDIYRVVLTGEVLAKISPQMGDLRLYGPDRREIPFVIIDHVIPEISGKKIILEIIRYQPGDDWVTILLKNPEPSEEINALTLDIPDRDFHKEIILDGSHDQTNWSQLVKDSIYDYSSQVDLRKVRLDFASSRFGFYRISMRDAVKPKGQDPAIHVRAKGVNVSIHYPEAKKIMVHRIVGHSGNHREAVTIYDNQMAHPWNSITKDRKTIIDIQAGVRFGRVDFEIDNPLYYRRVDIYYSETGTGNSYRLLTSGPHIYRTPDDTLNYIVNRFPHYPYIRFEIENKDDPPLNITGLRLTWVRKLLCFYGLEAASAYTLVFGNNQIAAPDYDIKKIIGQYNWTEVFAKQNPDSHQLTLTELSENPSFQRNIPDKQAKREGVILTIVVICLVTGLGIWLYKLLRKAVPKR